MSFAERMRSLTVTAVSPRRTVRVTLTGTGPATVVLRPGTLDGHTAASLSAEVTAAFGAACRGRRRAVDRLLRDAGTPCPAPGEPGRAASVHALDLSATSRAGGVTARWRDGVEVSVAPGLLGGRGAAERVVEAEIEDAVRVLMHRYARSVARILEAPIEEGTRR